MIYIIDKYGYSPESLIKSPEEVRQRLRAILGNKILRFNPYSVDDETLLSCMERAIWQPWPALTQMVVFHFLDIRKVEWKYPYEAIFFHVGKSPQETHLPLGALTDRVTYIANRRQVHVTVDGRPLTNDNMVERLSGKDYFVSHALHAEKPNGKKALAYRMFRLRGDTHDRAEKIRQSMLESKIFMLQEILAHPYCSEYLQCCRDFIDYVSPIRQALDAIRNFSARQGLSKDKDNDP